MRCPKPLSGHLNVNFWLRLFKKVGGDRAGPRLSLAVVATRPHPELSYEGIEQHDVHYSCGYQGARLYDPRDFLR